MNGQWRPAATLGVLIWWFVLGFATGGSTGLMLLGSGAAVAAMLATARWCPVSRLRIRRVLLIDRTPYSGQDVWVELTVETDVWWPWWALELTDDWPRALLPDDAGRITVSLVSTRRRTLRYRLSAVPRGAYSVRRIIVAASDPFGLITRRWPLSLPDNLVVWPAPMLPDGALPLAARDAVLSGPGEWLGIRVYQPGDPPARIHWKATAKTGQLLARDEELRVHSLTVAIPDVTSPAALEVALSQAAGLVEWGYIHGWRIGLDGNSGLDAIPPRSGRPQYLRVMDVLARYPQGGAP